MCPSSTIWRPKHSCQVVDPSPCVVMSQPRPLEQPIRETPAALKTPTTTLGHWLSIVTLEKPPGERNYLQDSFKTNLSQCTAWRFLGQWTLEFCSYWNMRGSVPEVERKTLPCSGGCCNQLLCPAGEQQHCTCTEASTTQRAQMWTPDTQGRRLQTATSTDSRLIY